MDEFEGFDPAKEESFVVFDVAEEADAAAEMTAESLGGLSGSRDQVESLVAARAEAEAQLTGPAGARAAPFSDDEPYNPANVGWVAGVAIRATSVGETSDAGSREESAKHPPGPGIIPGWVLTVARDQLSGVGGRMS